MQNKKVYLAKNVLASGFDVEYVKSHLERIPGIVLIEAGMGIDPSECAAFIIVPDANTKHLDSTNITLSKNVSQSLDEFIENYEGDEDVSNCIYVYKHPEQSRAPGDIEKTYPMAFYMDEEFETEMVDKDNYDTYSTVNIVDDDVPLLGLIAEHIDEDSDSWIKVPRHSIPPPVFAVPGVPSLEERKLKQYPSSVANSSVFDIEACQKQLDKLTGDRRRLLLLKRS